MLVYNFNLENRPILRIFLVSVSLTVLNPISYYLFANLNDATNTPFTFGAAICALIWIATFGIVFAIRSPIHGYDTTDWLAWFIGSLLISWIVAIFVSEGFWHIFGDLFHSKTQKGGHIAFFGLITGTLMTISFFMTVFGIMLLKVWIPAFLIICLYCMVFLRFVFFSKMRPELREQRELITES